MKVKGMSKSHFRGWSIFCDITLLVLVLSSCNTNTISAIPVTSTITAAASASITPVPLITLPPGTLSVVSTMDAIVAQKPGLQEFYRYYQECVYMPNTCVNPGLGLSPTGAWAVFFTGDGIKIVSVEGAKEWQVTFPELSGTEGAGTVSVAHWSQDDQYLYVFPRQDGADGGDEWFWGSTGTRLIRFDLGTGTWTDTKMGYAFSFSPNDRFLVYRSDAGIRIYDLHTGQEKVVQVKYPEYGRFTWSPDSQKILFVATSKETDLENRENGFTALVLDVERQDLQTIFENNPEFLYPVEWKDRNTVILEKLFDGFGEHFDLDLNTGVITPARHP